MLRLSAVLFCLFVSEAVLAADAPRQTSVASGDRSGITATRPTLAPFQHVRFCLRYVEDCQSTAPAESMIDATPETMAIVERINRRVNAAIAPREKSYGSDLNDRWSINSRSGDCNDYAVSKRHELIKLGMPSSALRLSVVRTETGAGHLVLVAHTTKGDLVLDNLTSAIRPWHVTSYDVTSYDWLKIQSAEDPRYWYEIAGPAVVAAVNMR
jgi:predicted transglutaminase-like cysteine proteinase